MVIDRSIEKDTIVLVTGISGFFGGHVASKLLKFGYRVRGTVRDVGRHSELSARLSEAADVTDCRLSLYSADLTSYVGWDDATAGCDYVIHTASPFPAVAPRHAADIIRPAREGTLRVIRAAQRAQVKSF
ncbi:NAD-dependent epimerase/dehydratase family protein [Cryobacterium sp. TMT4-31]|uniref:NAD-dependent epimerase/dehydratase family protein n=1 Tax=Cryobacterium sp. TMT4-31 TaxID=1259259 RepID=UPI0018E09E5A|nr:NAD-dependent epimerase/dehydratase family protein [Cryobacterium sp. TMT4-31]